MTVTLHIDGDRIRLDAPAGWISESDRDALCEALSLIRPTLARTCSPPLPHRSAWPAAWLEVWAEREAIAAEGGAADSVAVANADLRAMVARGELATDESADAPMGDAVATLTGVAFGGADHG